MSKYDPEKHCCPRWYKDFCDCVKEARKQERYENIDETERILEDNGIEYKLSKTPNVVLVDHKGSEVKVSLKRDRGLIKVNFGSSNKWYKYSKSSFLEKFKK